MTSIGDRFDDLTPVYVHTHINDIPLHPTPNTAALLAKTVAVHLVALAHAVLLLHANEKTDSIFGAAPDIVHQSPSSPNRPHDAPLLIDLHPVKMPRIGIHLIAVLTNLPNYQITLLLWQLGMALQNGYHWGTR